MTGLVFVWNPPNTAVFFATSRKAPKCSAERAFWNAGRSKVDRPGSQLCFTASALNLSFIYDIILVPPIPNFASFSFVETWKMSSHFLQLLNFPSSLIVIFSPGLSFPFAFLSHIACMYICIYVYGRGAFEVNWGISKQRTGGSHTKLVKCNLLGNRGEVRRRLGELNTHMTFIFVEIKYSWEITHSCHFVFGFCHLSSFSLEPCKMSCECKKVFHDILTSQFIKILKTVPCSCIKGVHPSVWKKFE